MTDYTYADGDAAMERLGWRPDRGDRKKALETMGWALAAAEMFIKSPEDKRSIFAEVKDAPADDIWCSAALMTEYLQKQLGTDWNSPMAIATMLKLMGPKGFPRKKWFGKPSAEEQIAHLDAARNKILGR
jgi:hypothetical protein